MTRAKDPAEIAATIRRSIEFSMRGSRRLRFSTLRDLFGFQAWSGQRKEFVAKLLADQGVLVQPPVAEASLDNWVVLSMPQLPSRRDDHPEPRPTAEFFDFLESVQLGSEREVEMHFVSPLFEKLGYTYEHEAAGFSFDMWEGGSHRRIEADLVYFAGPKHSIFDAEPLVLVECKAYGKGPDAGVGQVRSYSFWIKPAYYVTTDGDFLVVYNYQGGAVPDVKVLEMRRSELRDRFDEIYAILNREAVVEARREKIARLTTNLPGTDSVKGQAE